MNITEFFEDEDAVSPVIGVILMVAITVILAAVIASFVLGLGDQAQQTTPTAQFTMDFTDNQDATADELTITHDGGDSIEPERISFTAEGLLVDDGGSGDALYSDPHVAMVSDNTWSDFGSSSTVSAGQSLTLSDAEFEDTEPSTSVNMADSSVDPDGDSDTGDAIHFDEATIRVVYTDSSGDSSSTLATWEGPDA